MSYGINSTTLSSNLTEPFELLVNNNARVFNVTIKPSEDFVSGKLEVYVKNSSNDIYEPVFTGDGRMDYLCLVRPRTITVTNSIHSFKFIPVGLDADKEYTVSIENLSGWY